MRACIRRGEESNRVRRRVLIPLVSLVLLVVTASPSVAAPNEGGEAVQFDSRLLKGQATDTDLSAFRTGNPVEPGVYTLDLFVNDEWQGEKHLRFNAQPDSNRAAPCFERDEMIAFGVDPTRLSSAQADKDAACRTVMAWLPDAAARYDAGELRYDITVAQADLADTVRGAVPRSSWSRGITAGLLQYDLDLTHRRVDALGTNENGYLSLMAGFNIGGWQFRSDQIVQWRSSQGFDNDRIRTFVQRPLPAIRSQLTLGENFTDGRVFDAFGYRGFEINSDRRMLPRSRRGYAPVVRGQASTNARVEIRQNGQLIYQTTVSPGPFAIRDLYPAGYGGDLNVTVIEANGQTSRFSVPYANVPGLLRAGAWRYSVVGGQFRENGADDPFVLQTTVRHGFSNLLTGYGGINVTEGYAAGQIGVALNTRLGAFALDATHARTEFDDHPTQSGQSYELTYSRSLGRYGTSLSLVAYRYSTQGYYELGRALRLREQDTEDFSPFFRGRQRNRGQVNVSQQLGRQWGSFYLTGSIQDYWNRPDTTTSYQAGYRNRFHRLTYGLSLENRRFVERADETRVVLNVSLPLDNVGDNTVTASAATDFDNDGYAGSRLGLNSVVGEQRRLSWDASINDRAGFGPAGNANAAYRSGVSTLSTGISVSDRSRQVSVGARGSMVAHADGLTLSPQQGDNMVLVHAEGAEGADIVNTVGARINGRGYGLVAFATPYQTNRIRLDPSSAGDDVALETTSKQIVPWAGAVTRLDFSTIVGDPVLVHLAPADGNRIPLGASVRDPSSGDQIGLVGQGNQVYFRSQAHQGRLEVSWGKNRAKRCLFKYQYPATQQQAGAIHRLNAPCVSAAQAKQVSLE